MESSYKVRNYILDESTFSIIDIDTNQKKRIGTHDFLVLFELCRNAGVVISKEQLLEKAWPGKIVADSSITQAISNVRTLIGDNGKEQRWLKTISKVGYRLEDSIVCKIKNKNIAKDVFHELEEPIEQRKETNRVEEKNSSFEEKIKKYNVIFVSTFLVMIISVCAYSIYRHMCNSESEFNAMSFPEVVYQADKVIVFSHSGRISQSTIKYLGTKIKNNNLRFLAVMIKSNDYSISIVFKDGEILNKLVMYQSGKSSDEIEAMIKKEIDNAVI